MLKKLGLCISSISLVLGCFHGEAYGWIKVYEKNGVIYIAGSGERKFKRPKNSKRIEEKVVYYAKKYGLPVKLFKELVRAESNFNPKAISKKGALGLCQLMPETARRLGVKDPFDPDENLNAGARLLRELYLKYRDWKLVLAAYNAGEGAVERYGGVPPYRETENYVRKILRRSGRGEKRGRSVTESRNRKRKNYRIVMYRRGDTVIIAQQFINQGVGR